MATQLDSSNTLEDWLNELNTVISELGDIISLSTTDKSSIVNSLNELASELGDITSLSTTDKTNIVAAINELASEIGDIANLTTTDKSYLVAAINELDSEIGTISSLNTTDKTNIVAAINELVSDISDLNNNKLDNVVEDTTPQLGGNLDGQNNDITAFDAHDTITFVYEVDGNGDYESNFKIPYTVGGTVFKTTVHGDAGATIGDIAPKVAGVALGGGSHTSVGDTVSNVSHATANTFAVGDKLSFTVSNFATKGNIFITYHVMRRHD